MSKLLASLKTKPAFKVVLPFIFGLIFGKYLEINPLILFYALLVVFFSSFSAAIFHWRYANVLLVLAILVGGAFNYTLKISVFPKHHLRYFLNYKKKQIIKTTVTGFPRQKKDRLEVEVQVDTININGTDFRTTGNALLRFFNQTIQPEFGDRLQVFAQLQEPSGERNPGEFDYKKYLASQGIYGIINIRDSTEIHAQIPAQKVSFERIIFLIKLKLNNIVEGLHSDQHQALLKGLLLGLRSEISEDIKESFMKSGVIHALAISGMNVSYVIVLFFALFGLLRLPHQAQIILVILSVFLYNLLIGFEPPIVRASLMATIYLLGKLMQRPVDMLNILSAAALIILIISPLDLFQASFQLSFAAIISMVYIYQKLSQFFAGNRVFSRLTQHKIGEYVITLFLVSVAAQLGTLPISAFYFGQISVVSLVANLFVIPLIGVITAYGFVSLIFFFFSIKVAALFAATNSLCLAALIFLTKTTADFKFSAFEIGSISFITVAFFYAGLFIFLNLNKKVIRKMAVFSILVAANAAIWSPIFASKKWMKVIFFDVGQGDAALVTFPNGENILIDAGPNLEGFDAAKFFLLPYFKRNSFDRLSSVVLSHADNDHIGGMPSIFRNIKVNHLFDTGLYHQSAVCSTYQHLVDSLNLTQHCINRPGRMDNSEDYGVFLIHPATEFWKKYRTDVNNSSLVVKIVFGKRSFLFLGDVEKEAEDVLINYADLLNADVLKIPHHGSETSSTEALLKIVQPKFAIISVGKNNKFKFPSSTVIRRLDDLNIPVIRTDENGAVVFKTDGDKLVRKR